MNTRFGMLLFILLPDNGEEDTLELKKSWLSFVEIVR